MYDLLQGRFAAYRRCLELEGAGLIDCAADDSVTGSLIRRDTLTGYH